MPPGSGTRIGVDRDEDGFLDRNELDAGTDPADPDSFPGTRRPPPRHHRDVHFSTTPPTTLPFVHIQTRSLKLTDFSYSARRRFKFRARPPGRSPAIGVLPPGVGSADDPTIVGATLTVFNSALASNDREDVFLPPDKWTARSNGRYRFRDSSNAAITAVYVRTDSIRIRGGGLVFVYTLDEAAQGRITVRLTMGDTRWCAEGPAKTSGNPPSTARYDKPGKFVAQRRAEAPTYCPLPPVGSPNGAFLED